MKRRLMILLVQFIVVPMFFSGASAKDVTLRMLVWEGYAPGNLCEQFKKQMKDKYDVNLTLKISFVTGNDDFFPALRKNKTDIISPSHNVAKDKRWKLIRLRMVLPLNLDRIPNYKNIIPALKRPDYCTSNGKVYAVPHIRGPYGLAYNTEIIKKEPDSWGIFWAPQYMGKYAIGGADQYEHNVSMTALAMGIPPDKIYDYKTLNAPEIQSKLAQLATGAGRIWEGVDDPETLKGLSLAAVWGFSLPGLQKMGETWKMAEPREGTTGWVDNYMINHALGNSPERLKIAEEWLNFVLGDAYQAYVVRGLSSAPVTTTVSSRLTPEEIEKFHLDDPSHFERNRILWKILDKRDRKGLKRLWNNALKMRR